MTIYEENGYTGREDYLDSLVEEYGESVYNISDLLGETEDFDGLLVALEDTL